MPMSNNPTLYTARQCSAPSSTPPGPDLAVANSTPVPDIGRRRLLTHMVLPCLLPLGIVACGPQDVKTQRTRMADGTEDIWIGLAWPLSHPRRTLRNGMELALDEINAKGGVLKRRLRLRSADDKRSVDEGMRVAQTFVNDTSMVAAVAHIDTYIATQVAPTYHFSGMLMLSPGALDMALTEKNHPMVFRNTPNQHAVGAALANHAADSNYKRVAVYYSNDSSGRDLVSAFETQARLRRVEVVDRRSYNPVGSDHARVFEEWRELQRFDAILLAGDLPLAAEILRVLRQTGLKQAVLGGMGLDGRELTDLAGPAAEGVVAVSVFHPDMPLPNGQDFLRAYRKRYRSAPDAAAALGYDTLQMLAFAIEQAGSAQPERIAQALRRLKAWQGVTGPFSFDDRGDLHIRPLVLTQVREGHAVYLGSMDEHKCKIRRSSEGLVKEC